MTANPSPWRRKRQARYRKGWAAELLAAAWLMAKGYGIVARRYRTHLGEIDIIARRGRRIAFVEVKARAGFEEGLWAVTPRQRQRILRAAELWMQKHQSFKDHDRSFDIMVVVPWKGLKHHMQVFS